MALELIGKELKTECSNCNGTGKDKSSGVICMECDGRRIAKCYHDYIGRITNVPTKKFALLSLRHFMTYLSDRGYDMEYFENLVTFFKCQTRTNQSVCDRDLKTIKSIYFDFIPYLEQPTKKLKHGSIVGITAKIRRFYVTNDISIPDWKVVKTYFKESTEEDESRPYTAEEIKLIVKNSNECYQALVLLLASTGMRLGGIYDKTTNNFLKVRDFEEATKSFTERELDSLKEELRKENLPEYTGDVGKITVYQGSKKEKHITFCTPEAYEAINKYLNKRRAAGEIITPNSPLFRVKFDATEITSRKRVRQGNIPNDIWDKYEPVGAEKKFIPVEELERARINRVRNPKPLNQSDIGDYIGKRCVDLKIADRTITHKTESDSRGIRHEISAVHGFRKFFITTMSLAGVNTELRKTLTGHSLGVQKSYFLPQPWEKLVEYWKGVPDLTIDKSNHYKIEVKQVKEEKEEITRKSRQDIANEQALHMKETREAKIDYDKLMKKHDDLAEMFRKYVNRVKMSKFYPIPIRVYSRGARVTKDRGRS